jgi:hypothetical protein
MHLCLLTAELRRGDVPQDKLGNVDVACGLIGFSLVLRSPGYDCNGVYELPADYPTATKYSESRMTSRGRQSFHMAPYFRYIVPKTLWDGDV